MALTNSPVAIIACSDIVSVALTDSPVVIVVCSDIVSVALTIQL